MPRPPRTLFGGTSLASAILVGACPFYTVIPAHPLPILRAHDQHPN